MAHCNLCVYVYVFKNKHHMGSITPYTSQRTKLFFTAHLETLQRTHHTVAFVSLLILQFFLVKDASSSIKTKGYCAKDLIGLAHLPARPKRHLQRPGIQIVETKGIPDPLQQSIMFTKKMF